MGRKPKDSLYVKVVRGVRIEKWIVVYFKENKLNLSEICNKLLKEYIKKQC